MTLHNLQAWDGVDFHSWFGFSISVFAFFFAFVVLHDEPVSEFPMARNPELYEKGEEMGLQPREYLTPARA